jgi:hypothetical protein
MARFCAEILATGSQCTQFARKGQPWCHAHANPALRERNADTRQQVAWVAGMDVFAVACTLGNIAYELRLKLILPLHAEALLKALLGRLDQLTGELDPELSPPEDRDKPHHNSGLHVVPVK